MIYTLKRIKCIYTLFGIIALAGCAHAPLVSQCISAEQYEKLAQSEPAKVHSKLTGKADEDIRPITGSAIELRSWGEELLGVLKICSQPTTEAGR